LVNCRSSRKRRKQTESIIAKGKQTLRSADVCLNETARCGCKSTGCHNCETGVGNHW